MDMHNTATTDPTKFKFNLKGFIVGNGVTNWKWDGDQAYMQGAFPRQLQSKDFEKAIKEANCNFYYEDNEPEDSPRCQELGNDFFGNTSNINVYDIYRTCWTVNQTASPEEMTYGFVELDGEQKPYKKKMSTKAYTPWLFDKKLGNGHPMLGVGDCTWDDPLSEFFNAKATRAAMHIPDAAGVWEQCSDTVGYISGHKASEWIYTDTDLDLKSKYRILHYSGDTDGAVPTEGTQ